MRERFFRGSQKTKETDIQISLRLDGKGNSEINTGIGFFDHMLEQVAKHGLMDFSIMAKGDIAVDFHHTVEDVGILLGKGMAEALGDKKGIKRYATVFTPMDEALSMVSIDISGRPYLIFDVNFTAEKVGTFDVELVEEFFRAVAFNFGITLHIKTLYGTNNHHIIDSIFKGFGRGIDGAIMMDERIEDVLSTKGCL